MLLGLTGVGKSTLLHALSGKQMYEVDDGTRKSVKVMSEDIIRGSRIGDTANSTTKMANAIPIGEGAQQLLLIDTPGFADTEGHMDNILTAVSTARTMQLCSSLRIVMLIKQADVTDEKLGALVDLGKTISKLFADFSTASMSLAVWVVKPTEKIKEKRMEKMLKKACEQKTCQARFAQRCKQTSRASAPSCVCSRLSGGPATARAHGAATSAPASSRHPILQGGRVLRQR